jgi:protein TonB
MTGLIVVLIIAVVVTAVSLDVSWTNILNKERNDIVFQNKFKEYGAYKIRKGHGMTLGIALGSTVFVAAAGFTAPMIFGKKAEETVEIPAEKIVEMLAPPPTNPEEPPSVEQIKFTEIEVTEEEVKDPPPAVEELKDQNISTTTQEGEEGPVGPVEVVTIIEEVKPEEPVSFAQEMPQYPGGELQMQKDIMENAPYPEMEKENNIQGKVYVQFVVEKDGAVTNVRVQRGVQGGPNLSRVAENAVKKLKKFAPAKQNGRPVRLVMTIPVNFTLK